jgi:hypothetical protein
MTLSQIELKSGLNRPVVRTGGLKFLDGGHYNSPRKEKYA